MDLLTGYINIQKKPFSVLDFVQATGVIIPLAEVALAEAEREGRIRAVNGAWVVRPQSIQMKRISYDFKPNKDKLKDISNLMITGMEYASIDLANRLQVSDVVMHRYLNTLAYMGCIRITSSSKRLRRYIKESEYREVTETPYYFNQVQAWLRRENGKSKRNAS